MRQHTRRSERKSALNASRNSPYGSIERLAKPGFYRNWPEECVGQAFLPVSFRRGCGRQAGMAGLRRTGGNGWVTGDRQECLSHLEVQFAEARNGTQLRNAPPAAW